MAEADETVSDAVVEEKGRLSIVWVIPVVALLVGAWLAYVSISQRGPAITITFKSAEGLEAGKTKIKYKDVVVGDVETIGLSDDLSKVVVGARMVKGAAHYLTANTRFWVVRARVSAGQVSGLSTLFSGAYIRVDPSTEGETRRHFEGLEVAPVVTSDEEGTFFKLHARDLGSIDVGSPVYYRWIRVGEVSAYELDPTGELVTVTIFVRSPDDARVTRNTVFWNASGIDAQLTAEGVQIDTVSLTSILIGGIAFDTSSKVGPGGPPDADTIFPLYANKRATTEPLITTTRRFVVHFNQDVGGLVRGAPVEFRGIRIGEVLDVRLMFDPRTVNLQVPVVIEVQPERLGIVGGLDAASQDEQQIRKNWNTMVDRGMRAQLKNANLLTGALSVSLDLHPDAEPAEIDWDAPIPVMPTVSGGMAEITAGLRELVKRIEEVPIEEIGENLAATLGELRDLSRNLNEDVTPQLAGTLAKAEAALSSADTMIAPDSEASHELRRLMLELADAARSIRLLAERLEQHPEEVIRGKEANR